MAAYEGQKQSDIIAYNAHNRPSDWHAVWTTRIQQVRHAQKTAAVSDANRKSNNFDVCYLPNKAVDNFVDKRQNKLHNLSRNAWKGAAGRHLYEFILLKSNT